MEYIREFEIDINRKQIITVTGSGGKTTLIENLAEELVNEGKTVLIATSTKIMLPTKCNEVIVLNDEILRRIKLPSPAVIYGGKAISKDDKIIGFDEETISEISNNENIDFVLVEGDGSKRMPIKGYSSFEPVVPEGTEILISVLGMNSLFTRVNDANVHRLEEFKKITGLKDEEEIKCEHIYNLFQNDNGYFKVKAKRNIIFLNRINDRNSNCAEEIRYKIEKKLDFIEKVVLGEESKC
jgi:probable selenium-dependent hydroxylase accessory protein YqeC